MKDMSGHLVETSHYEHVTWSTVWLHKGAMFLCEWEQSTKSALDGVVVASQTQSDIRFKKNIILENMFDPDEVLKS
jgi:hypothetical protein